MTDNLSFSAAEEARREHEAASGESLGKLASDFANAIRLLKLGRRVARLGWNGKGMWLALMPEADGPPPFGTIQPWIGMKTVQGTFVPWLASQTDMLANDWVMVVESKVTLGGLAERFFDPSSRPMPEQIAPLSFAGDPNPPRGGGPGFNGA